MHLTKHIQIILTVILFNVLPPACQLDQVQSEYKNYQQASEAGLFEKGWIPKEFIHPSMTDIYLRTNIDLNSCIFSFQLETVDIIKVQKSLLPNERVMPRPQRIKIPQWWLKEVATNPVFSLKKPQEVEDTVFVSLDYKNSIIYGWIN